MGCVWWILAIFLLLIAVGHIYLWILDRLKKHVSSHGDLMNLKQGV